jgi:glycine cleavage system aminomethyltransferase T
MLDTTSGYHALRNTAGAYRRGTSILSVTGADRGALVSYVCAKRTEFAQPGTVTESIALTPDGRVDALILVIVEDERILLASDQVVGLDADAIAAALGLTQVAVADVTAGFTAASVEGPRSWRAVDELVDDDISSILLNELRVISVAGSAGSAGSTGTAETTETAAPGLLARVGTTAEYGYLILIEAPAAEIDALDVAVRLAEQVGGGEVNRESLLRAQAEVSHPLVPAQFEGLSIAEAGALWTLSADREDEFSGRSVLDAGLPGRRLIAVTATASDAPEVGAAVFAGETQVGRIQVSLARAGQPNGFALALLDTPFHVPGLTLNAAGTELLTVSRPAVDLISWAEPIGS